MGKPQKPSKPMPVEDLHDESTTDLDEQNDESQFQGVSGPSSPAPEPPRFVSLDEAIDSLELYFRMSHGLSIDKAKVEEFVAYYRSLGNLPAA